MIFVTTKKKPARIDIRIYGNTLTNLFFVSTIIDMEMSFDTIKDAANLEKHGISLAAAAMIE